MKFPGIKILDRYIIRKFLGTYIFAIALIIVVVVIFDAAEKMDDFIELKAPLSKIIFQYYLKADNPKALLRGNKTLKDYGVRNGTEIRSWNRE